MSPTDMLTILSATTTTLLLSVTGILLGLPIGLGLALIRWARVPFANQFVRACVSLLRATPLVTLVLLLFFALPNAGVAVGPIAAAVIALTLNTSAFNCEIWRAALIDFPKDQLEAAQSVGMKRLTYLRRIVLPQIARSSLPALISEMSQVIKVTPVLAVVGVVEITRAAVRVGAETYEPLPPFLFALAIYLPIIYALLRLQRRFELNAEMPA